MKISGFTLMEVLVTMVILMTILPWVFFLFSVRQTGTGDWRLESPSEHRTVLRYRHAPCPLGACPLAPTAPAH